eukprot:gene11436-biopygen9411
MHPAQRGGDTGAGRGVCSAGPARAQRTASARSTCACSLGPGPLNPVPPPRNWNVHEPPPQLPHLPTATGANIATLSNGGVRPTRDVVANTS